MNNIMHEFDAFIYSDKLGVEVSFFDSRPPYVMVAAEGISDIAAQVCFDFASFCSLGHGNMEIFWDRKHNTYVLRNMDWDCPVAKQIDAIVASVDPAEKHAKFTLLAPQGQKYQWYFLNGHIHDIELVPEEKAIVRVYNRTLKEDHDISVSEIDRLAEEMRRDYGWKI